MNANKSTVLIVESTEFDLLLLSNILHDKCNILCAKNNAEAFAILNNQVNHISLIIVDIISAETNGFQLLSGINNSPLFNKIPVVVITSFEDIEQEVMAFDLGAADLIYKPFDSRIIKKRIVNLIDKRKSEEQQQENANLDYEVNIQDQLQLVLDSMVGGVALIQIGDGTARALYLNSGFYEITGYNQDIHYFNAHTFMDIIHPQDRERVMNRIYTQIKTNNAFTCEYRIVKNDGGICWLSAKAVRIDSQNSRLPILLTIFTDITYAKATEMALQTTTDQFTALVDNVPGGVAIFKIADTIKSVYENDGFYEMFGYTKDTYQKDIKENCEPFILPEDIPVLSSAIDYAVANKTTVDVTIRIRNKQGKYLHIMVRGKQIKSEKGSITTFFAILIDVTKEFVVEQTLKYQTEYDVLTGVYNKDTFCSKAKELLVEDIDNNYCIVCLDLERFKVLNDIFGTNQGDKVLIYIGTKLQTYFYGKKAVYGRIAGDVFAVCMQNVHKNVREFIAYIETILKEYPLDFELVSVIGIYIADDVNVPVSLMCDRARLALNSVKGNYVKRYSVYDAKLRDKLLEEQAIINEMNTALATNQFCMYLQPIYSISGGLPISAEALVRWIHPTKGIIPPGEFIPIFERNGFIMKLDNYIWECACKQLKKWKEQGKALIPISVNVSRINLYNPKLCQDILALVKRYEIEPKYLKIEITESAYTDNPIQLIGAIKQLQKYGFPILMDDFGSGYSSLNMLKDVPVDILKIDMRFMENLNTEDRAGSILTSVLRMARWLKLPVIAEGVETREQIDYLHSIGCDMVQGYFFSKPLPILDFEKLRNNPIILNNITNPKTNKSFDFDTLWYSNTQINKLFNGIVDGMGIYELTENSLEVVRVSDGYYSLMGYTQEYLDNNALQAFSMVEESDQKAIYQKCMLARDTNEVQDVTVQLNIKALSAKWLNAKIRYLGGDDARSIFYIAINDVTAQRKAEYVANISKYSSVLSALYNQIFEVNLTTNTYSIIHHTNNSFIIPKLSGDFTDIRNFISENLIHPEDKNIYLRATSTKALKKFVDYKSDYTEFRTKTTANNYLWVGMTTTKMEYGNEEIFLFCLVNIQDKKDAERIREKNILLEMQKKQKERYKIIVEQANAVVIEWNYATNEFYASDNIMEYKLGSVIKTINLNNELKMDNLSYDVIHKEDEAQLIALHKAIHSADKNVTITIRLKKTDDTYAWCKIVTSVILSRGKPERLISTIYNIDNDVRLSKQLSIEEERYRLLAEGLNTIIFEYDVINDQMRLTLNNINKEKTTTKCFSNYMEFIQTTKCLADETRKDVIDKLRLCCSTKTTGTVDFIGKIGDKDYLWYRARYTSFVNNQGAVYKVIGKLDSIQSEKQTSQQLRKEQSYRDAFLGGMIFVCEYNLVTGRIKILQSHKDNEKTYYSIAEYMDTEANKLLHKDDAERVKNSFTVENFLNSYYNGITQVIEQCRIIDKQGNYVWVEITMHMLNTEDDKDIRVLVYVKDINKEKLTEKELQRKAERDSLSGLYNRRTIETKINKKLSRLTLDKSYSFMIMDIDNFKSINDSYGHQTGDRVIVKIAEIMKKNYPSHALLGRMGGDEFVLFTTDGFSEEKVFTLLSDINKISTDFGKVPISVSIGVSTAPMDGTTFTRLYSRSDQALYHAKNNGKNTYHMYSNQ